MTSFSLKAIKTIIARTAIIALFISSNIVIYAQNELDFYTPPTQFKKTQNFVKKYGVDNDFATDDSKILQNAINNISHNGGGKLIIPKGNYTFSEVNMKSNVHIEFDPGVVIRPSIRANNKNYSIINFGRKGGAVENVSLTTSGSENKYTIDLTATDNLNVTVFALRNIENFLFSNVIIKDNQTKFSSFTLGIVKDNGGVHYPSNGVIRNATTTNADYGYGLIQVQAAKNVLFEDLGGQGGVTLRLETGEKKMNNLQIGGVFDIYANNIECRDGNAAVMISPHAMKNGIVTVDGVTSNNCGFAVRIGGSYVAKKYRQDIGLSPGTFDPKSSVKNVTATFGRTAQVKPKHFKYIPLEYQTKNKTSETPITNTHSNPKSTKSSHSVFAVSVAAVGYFAGKSVECTDSKGKKSRVDGNYEITIDKSSVKAIGFKYQQPIIDLTDDVLSDCRFIK